MAEREARKKSPSRQHGRVSGERNGDLLYINAYQIHTLSSLLIANEVTNLELNANYIKGKFAGIMEYSCERQEEIKMRFRYGIFARKKQSFIVELVVEIRRSK